MLDGLNQLSAYHFDRCSEYARIVQLGWGGLKQHQSLAEIPYLPVTLFKELSLSSTKSPTFVMRSSGTTGQTPSQIVMDNETAERQAKALSASFRPILGGRRLPFLAIDTRDVIKDASLTARGAGVLGMMKFGAKATFALDLNLNADKDIINRFVSSSGAEPFLIFGFTYLVWTKLFTNFSDGEIDLSNAILVHSGGGRSSSQKRSPIQSFAPH